MVNIAVSDETHYRLKWYRESFEFDTLEDVIKEIMKTAGVASAEDIRQFTEEFVMKKKGGKDADAASAEDDPLIGTPHTKALAGSD